MQLLYQGRDIMLSREELLKMREMTFEDIDPKEIQDVEKLKIDVKKEQTGEGPGNPGVRKEPLFSEI